MKSTDTGTHDPLLLKVWTNIHLQWLRGFTMEGGTAAWDHAVAVRLSLFFVQKSVAIQMS